jgi:hypothetical protein
MPWELVAERPVPPDPDLETREERGEMETRVVESRFVQRLQYQRVSDVSSGFRTCERLASCTVGYALFSHL